MAKKHKELEASRNNYEALRGYEYENRYLNFDGCDNPLRLCVAERRFRLS